MSSVNYQISWRWGLQVIPAGLVLHFLEETVAREYSGLPTDPEHFDLLVATELSQMSAEELLPSLSRFVDELPSRDRVRLRLRLAAGTDSRIRSMFRAAVPAPQLDQPQQLTAEHAVDRPNEMVGQQISWQRAAPLAL